MQANSKELILSRIVERLSEDLNVIFSAAKTAHEASIHEESAPDNKYDTLSLEASYVAQGQANRAQEIKIALELYRNLDLQHFDEDSPIRLTALVTLAADGEAEKTVFIGPLEGGLKVEHDGTEIIVITPGSPLGAELLGKVAGETVVMGRGRSRKDFEIISVY